MKNLFAILTMFFFLVACSNSTDPFDENVGSIAVVQDKEDDGVNVLTSPIVSDPANDPYSVENMNRAMRQRILAKSAANVAEVEQMSLEPNYLYVRFLAEGKRGAAELKAYDTSLVLFKHPLDYKHIRKPVVYRDPALPDSVISLFATVPVDYKFGPTKYEIIKELFLVEPLDDDCEDDDCVDEDSATTERALLKRVASKFGSSTFEKLEGMGISLHEIEWESMKMTDNLGLRLSRQERNVGELPAAAWSILPTAKKYRGELKFWDDQLGAQPLEGVRVTGGYSYYWREAHTDGNGKFSIPEKWRYSIDYEANFDDDQFLLEDGHSKYGEDLEIEKNNMKDDWKETFTDDKAKWCIVWTAAYQYWHGNNFGLRRPRQNDWSNLSLDIEVYYKNKRDYDAVFSATSILGCNAEGSSGQYGNAGVFENICILAHKQPSYTIYGTTIHEIAHSSHYWNMKTTNPVNPQWGEYTALMYKYRDTYARGVQNYFIADRYGSKYMREYDNQYTGLVEDLIDNDASSTCTKVKELSQRDNVSGFVIGNIETAFFQNKDFSSLKSYLIKNNPSGKNGVKYTSKAMDNLFKCWGLE